MKSPRLVAFLFALFACASAARAELIAYYPFDTDGSAAVGTDAVLGSAASISASDNVFGGGALALAGSPDSDSNGSDGAVSGNTFAWASDERTVAFWMKATADDKGDNNASLVTLGEADGDGSRFDIRLSGNNLRLEIHSTGYATSTQVADGTWHHISVVVPFDGATLSNCQYYVDGTYVGTFGTSEVEIDTATSELRVGDGVQDSSRDFKGLIDEVMLFDHALSAAEIAEVLAGDGAYLGSFSATPETFIVQTNIVVAWETQGAGWLELDDGTSVLATYTASADGQTTLDAGSLSVGMVSNATTYTLRMTEAEDGSGDIFEQQATVAPLSLTVDSDRDGLPDLDELTVYETDRYSRDTDGDGTPDGMEVERGLDPLDPDESLDRPNIIFFFTDDQGYGDLGCFWQDQRSGIYKFDTPKLDSIAAEGAMLTHHYVAAPICVPSRASLLSGRHQGHAEIRNIQFDKALPDNHTLADMLRRAGYRTIHLGKNGIAGGESSVTLTGTGSQNLEAHPLKRGFDEYFGYLFHGDAHEHYPRNGTSSKTAHIYYNYQQIVDASEDLYTTDAWTAYAKDAIIREVNDGDNQPFFLYLAYDAPHFNNQRPAVAYPAGGGLTGGIQWTTETDGSGNVRYASTADGTGTIDAYNHPDNDPSWDTTHSQVVGMIRRIDNSIGDIQQLLVDLGIDDNTLIVFTTDNGPDGSSRDPRYFESYAGFEGTKQDILEGGLRVPTVVRWPNGIAGATGDENNIQQIARPCVTYDWMPTFAAMAGIAAPSWCDGVSLLPTLTGEGVQRDKGYLYFEFKGYSGGAVSDWDEFPNHRGEIREQQQAVRIGDYMGLRMNITDPSDPFRIYDVTTDLGEGTDLAASMPELEAEMQAIALQARRAKSSAPRPDDDEQVPNASRALEQGLSYSYHEGIWSYVPEFRDLAAVKEGQSSSIDLSVRSRDDHVGLLFYGYIEVPTAGDYTFYVTSDSGANLFLHDAHVIDDDYNHDGSEQSGTVTMEAGLHPFRLYYRHGRAASHALDFSWSGPALAKETIPASSFYRIPEIRMAVGAGDGLNLKWNSLAGQSYRLRSSDSLSTPVGNWTIEQSGITSTAPTNTLSISVSTNSSAFYVVEEE
jgi:arylsulfatase A-like enzyme